MLTALPDNMFLGRLEDRMTDEEPTAFQEGGELPNLRHLRAILLVGETQSVNRAALIMNLSQPAITQAISRIERDFGRVLFQRHPTGMFLTETGRILCQRIARAFDILETAVRAAHQNIHGRDQESGDPSLLFRSGQLHVLAALVQFRNFETTAGALGKSVASIQRNIRNLEDRLNTSLVLREGAFVHFTKAGEQLARVAKLARREIELAREERDALDGVARGRLVIGALPLARSYMAPKAMIEIAMRHPEVRVRLVEGTYNALLEGLRDGDIDILIGALRDPAPGDDIAQATLFEEQLQVVARAGHPALSIGRLELADLLKFPWVAPRVGSPARRQFDLLMNDAHARPAVMMEAASHMAIRAILLESDCLALISRHQMRYEELSGQLTIVPTNVDVAIRAVGYACRKNWQPTRLHMAFLESLKTHAVAQPETASEAG